MSFCMCATNTVHCRRGLVEAIGHAGAPYHSGSVSGLCDPGGATDDPCSDRQGVSSHLRAQGAFGLVRPREIDRGPGSVLDGTCHLGPNRPGKPGSLQLAQGRPG